MSYDVGLYINTGKEEHEIHDCGNYTYNVSDMIVAAGIKGGINSLGGMLGEEAEPIVRDALQYLIDHVKEMREYEPDNGWGNVEGATQFLTNIYMGCKTHPKAIVRVY